MPKLKTENLGVALEQVICEITGITYGGKKSKYTEDCDEIKHIFFKNDNLIKFLNDSLDGYSHTGSDKVENLMGKQVSHPFDFEKNTLEGELHIQCKSNKNGSKVAPRSIGQPSKEIYSSHFDYFYVIEEEGEDNYGLKTYIQINIDHIFRIKFKYMFDCPILYYQKDKDFKYIQLIKPIEPIDYSVLEWTKSILEWNESTTLKINGISVMEIQIHNKRNCVKSRFILDNVLKLFHKHFEVIRFKL